MDLSHWDLVSQFTIAEAASLAAGVDPHLDTTEPEAKAKKLLLQREMHRASHSAYSTASFYLPSDNEPDIDAIFAPGSLVSVQLLAACVQCQKANSEKWFWADWHFDINEQLFRRETLDDWLTSVRFKSLYSFVRTKDASVGNDLLGARERKTAQMVIAGLLADRRTTAQLERPYTIAKQIESALASCGLSLSDEAIVGWVKSAIALMTAVKK